ncbi:hypothetical protein GRZ40_001387 [Salmonella bongori]|uniref:Uncharacterized protein n=2 Tax=Salmonella TaxID=590 RepID=A0A750KGH3_SALER|nr:hypothetical protein [Salmonella bongori]EGE4653472.1 hypothetical protein [Salmonella bongori serovar 40:z35:- str. 95-0123]EGE4657975.1 hypothetical protein [Salmonella bongori serovar 48:i:- str. 94-0708]EGS1130081.1 hypothetical protein [Salmonella bongori CFSAN000509]EDP8575103.1 hypothetical protein [Salmonella bongori]
MALFIIILVLLNNSPDIRNLLFSINSMTRIIIVQMLIKKTKFSAYF